MFHFGASAAASEQGVSKRGEKEHLPVNGYLGQASDQQCQLSRLPCGVGDEEREFPQEYRVMLCHEKEVPRHPLHLDLIIMMNFAANLPPHTR
jgi:hypothetical protein